MPDRFEKQREELMKQGLSYQEAKEKVAKEQDIEAPKPKKPKAK